MTGFLKVFILGSFITTVNLISQNLWAESAAQIKMTESQIREQMIQITKELGTSCAECHDTQNFKNSSLPNHRVGKDHLKIVQMLRDNGMNGRNGPEASCYMCHRGQLKYDFENKEAEKKSPAPKKSEH